MFVGSYTHAVDGKGRVSVPRAFLDPLKDPGVGRLFYATRGFDLCVFLFLKEDWERFSGQVRSQAAFGNPKDRGFARQFFSMARELPVDKSGRILLPKEYRDLAGIETDGDAVFAGVDRCIEVWSPDRWVVESAKNIEDYTEQAGEIFRA